MEMVKELLGINPEKLKELEKMFQTVTYLIVENNITLKYIAQHLLTVNELTELRRLCLNQKSVIITLE